MSWLYQPLVPAAAGTTPITGTTSFAFSATGVLTDASAAVPIIQMGRRIYILP